MDIEAKRKSMGMTQQEVSDKVGITRGAYCNIENGSRRPSPSIAKKLGSVLGIPWTQFYDGEEDDHEDAASQ